MRRVQVNTEQIARDLTNALGPRAHCIEVIDPIMAQVLQNKTEWERLEIAAGMWRSARRILQAAIRRDHPEWSVDEIDGEAARRMSDGLF